MQELIKLFPLIYAIWGGILIVSGGLICAGFYKMMTYAKRKGKLVRQSDKLNMAATAVISVLNVISIFVQHDSTSYILDALILGHFWCTIYFASLIHTQLTVLPQLSRAGKKFN